MTRIANKGARSYSSELRAQQAEETRSRILDATVRVMARGLVTLSIPDVAREAGVSVPTVYRHFRTKQDLVAAVYPHLAARTGINQPQPPGTVDELRDGVRAYFGSLDALDEAARAAMASPASDADPAAHHAQPGRDVAAARRFDQARAVQGGSRSDHPPARRPDLIRIPAHVE